MFCPSCGNALHGEEAFCTHCGQGVSSYTGAVGDQPDAGDLALLVPWRGGQVVLGIGAVGLAFLLISSVLLILERADLIEGATAWAAWAGSHAIGFVIVLVVWFLCRSQGQFTAAALGLRKPRLSWPVSMLMTSLALSLSFGATALYAWLARPLGVEWLLPPDLPRDLVFQGAAAFWTFEALAVVTPITEELFFRGFIMAGLVSRWGVVGAAVGSSLIFASFHLHPGVLLPIFVTGLLLAGLYHYTGSLWPPIIAHAIQNTIALGAVIYGG